MSNELSKLSTEELETHLLSDDYLLKLRTDNAEANYDSFGLRKKRIEGADFMDLILKFPDLPLRFDSVIRDNLDLFGNRVHSHLERLINEKRTLAENYFGLLCAYYGCQNGKRILPPVTGEQFKNTTFFWSVGPYLAQELTYYGVPPNEIAEIIFSWGKNAHKENVLLPGIGRFQKLGTFNRGDLVLSVNPANKTHEFASGLAQLLCQKLDMFREIIVANNPLRTRDTSRPFNCDFHVSKSS